MLSLILFLLGIICIVSGNTIMSSDDCNQNVDIRIVPRHVYDEVVSNSTL